MTRTFQSTSLSRGKTDMDLKSTSELQDFQSTSLSRGKTRVSGVFSLSSVLSIHFPLTREDDFNVDTVISSP